MAQPSMKRTLLAILVVAAGVIGFFGYRRLRDSEIAKLPPAQRGLAKMEGMGCRTCHQVGSSYRAPLLEHLVGKEREFIDGSKVRVDASYIRESLLRPEAKVVAGYQAVMPSYEGRLVEEDIADLAAAME